MSLTVLLALFSMLAQGASDFFYKKAQERGIVLESYLVIEVIPFVSVAIVFGYLTGDLTPDREALAYGPLLGLLSFTAIFAFVTSLREGEAGVNTLIFRFNFILVAVIAFLWLGEDWSLTLGAGLLLAILAIASAALLGNTRARSARRSLRPIALAFIAMIFFAFLNVTFKVAVREETSISFLILVTTASWTVCASVVMVARKKWQFPRNNWIFMSATGSLKALAFFSMLSAFRIGGAASVVVPIVQLSFLVTIVLAAVFLRERLGPPKLIGLGFAITAIFMISR